MNTQNILKFYGSKLDIRLDSSEFYDYEVTKTENDYNSDVLDLSTSITYTALTINESLEDFGCSRNTIKLTEYDNRTNDPSYIYSGLSATVTYSSFVNHISPTYQHTILNDDVYEYEGLTGETHYFTITSFNQSLSIHTGFTATNETDLILGFVSGTTSIEKCEGRLDSPSYCCPFPPKLSNKPWAYQFIDPIVNGCNPFIKRRTEKGWTLDFIFNRESLPWSSGGVFYYFGTRGSSNIDDYADNNLSFRFTSDRRIRWTAIRYSGECVNNAYTESYYVDSDQTVPLCTTGTTKDFNVTIVFDRYKRYTECNLENDGGWNDLLGWRIDEYSESGTTSTQLVTYDAENEELNKKWADERERRLGVLKIYLNGRPIYKKENWEEVVPSKRGVQPFIQSWGGGTGLMTHHDGVCCFNMKSIKYYEDPLDFVHVRHNFLTRLNQYDFFICGLNCEDDVYTIEGGHIINQNGEIITSSDGTHILYRT